MKRSTNHILIFAVIFARVRQLITADLGLTGNQTHAKPWEEPDCEAVESIGITPYDQFVKLEALAPTFKKDLFLQNVSVDHIFCKQL